MNLQKLHVFVTENFEPIKKKVNKVFNQTIERSRLRGINSFKFIKELNKELKSSNIKLTPQFNKNDIETQYPVVSAFCYEPNSPEKIAKIEIIVSITKFKILALSESDWEVFRYNMFEILLHELVHRAQYFLSRCRQSTLAFRTTSTAKTNENILADQLYLGQIDEIESYARDCVEHWNYTKPGKLLNMRELKKEFCFETNIHAIQYYYDAYEGDKTNLAVLRFFRKVLEWNKLITPLALELPKCPLYVRNLRRTK